MGFGEAIKTCFRKYFTISGRAPRSEYWYFFLFVMLLSILGGVLDALFFGVQTLDSDTGGPLEAAASLLTLIPSITAAVRRLHDTNRPGYYIFAPLIFFAVGGFIFVAAPESVAAIIAAVVIMLFGFLLQLYWLIQKSDPGDNRYGPNPFMGERLDQVFE